MITRDFENILPFFILQDGAQSGTATPHDGQDGYIYATNLEASIRVPKGCVDKDYDQPGRHPDVRGLFEKAANAPGVRAATIERDDIITALTREGHAPFVKIGAQTFAAHHVMTMFAVCVIAEAERITYRADDGPKSPALFDIGNGITILLLPTSLRVARAEVVKLS